MKAGVVAGVESAEQNMGVWHGPLDGTEALIAIYALPFQAQKLLLESNIIAGGAILIASGILMMGVIYY
jgi:hypothetical protein